MKLIVDYIERLVLILLFAAATLANLVSAEPLNLLLSVGHACSIGFVLFRRRGSDVSLNPLDWTIAVLGTVLSLMLRPSATSLGPEILSGALLWVGAALTIAAKLSLNTRFGVVPANRGVQSRGAYRMVRHPMYLGYLVVEAGYVLQNFSLGNVALLGVVWPLQVIRMMREERWLERDDAYRQYQRRTRFKLVPGLF